MILVLVLFYFRSPKKILLFTIQSERIDCPAVVLSVYSDNTYVIGDKKGTYSYDVSKIISKNNRYEETDLGPYILKNQNGKIYYIYDTNKEFQEFLESIDVNLDTCQNFNQ